MWCNVALVYMKLNQSTECLEYANKAIELSPQYNMVSSCLYC